MGKIEQRTDRHGSTLRGFIWAMGREQEIVARLPDHRVRIANFAGLSERGPV